MRLPRAALRRHALRVLLALAAVAVLAAAPPALSAGLPGPGIWPRIVGAGLFVGALLLPPASAAKERPSRKALREAGGLLFSCLLWMLLVYALAGFLPPFSPHSAPAAAAAAPATNPSRSPCCCV